VSDETKKKFDAALGTVATLLIAGNIFFVKRLVDEIDCTKRTVMELKIEVAKIQTRLGIPKNVQDANFRVQSESRRTPL
jgi:preprotein translocase subunit SecF